MIISCSRRKATGFTITQKVKFKNQIDINMLICWNKYEILLMTKWKTEISIMFYIYDVYFFLKYAFNKANAQFIAKRQHLSNSY